MHGVQPTGHRCHLTGLVKYMQKMNAAKENSALSACLLNVEETQDNLDIRSFQLKTLNDLSKELFESVDTETIIRKFLLTTMGNLGVLKGFVLLVPLDSDKVDHFASVGFEEREVLLLRDSCRQCGLHGTSHKKMGHEAWWACKQIVSQGIEMVLPFLVEKGFQGILGLGPKLMASPFAPHEKELLETLINNLVIAIKNAQSFEKVLTLNQRLSKKNTELEDTLQELSTTIQRVELLENIKDNLSKFVPKTVTNMIEASRGGLLPESREQDLSILFLDIAGYTKLCEKFGSTKVNHIVEKHFSVFMDAIHSNNGDVNETAGDGLMVLFLNEDKQKNALDAARTALSIQKETRRIGHEMLSLYRPLDIHMGIHSGTALVGAAKFSSLTGSRWTYTARGQIANVASRIASLANGSSILISKVTSDRVCRHHSVKPMGKFRLKNVTDEVEILKLLPDFRTGSRRP
jgi:class 3 adenylate cyclase